MTAWDLPASLDISGRQYKIRTDFRVILDILMAMNDPELYEPDADENERQTVSAMLMLQILYEDFEEIPPEHYGEAVEKAAEFINGIIPMDAAKSIASKAEPKTIELNK